MALHSNPRRAWGQLRGAGKPRRPLQTQDTTSLAAAATSEDKYARYGPRGSIRPATSALNRNARRWACLSLLQEKL
jgi:hypothetical protein